MDEKELKDCIVEGDSDEINAYNNFVQKVHVCVKPGNCNLGEMIRHVPQPETLDDEKNKKVVKEILDNIQSGNTNFDDYMDLANKWKALLTPE